VKGFAEEEAGRLSGNCVAGFFLIFYIFIFFIYMVNIEVANGSPARVLVLVPLRQ